jgi:hypothetical protein
MMTRWVCSAAAIALFACGGDDGPDGSAPELVLGSASEDRTQFVPVDDGADVPLVPGSQGGFHVWTGLRLRGATGIIHLEREVRRISDDAIVLLASTYVMEVPDEAVDQWWEQPHGEANALPSFMCPTPIGVRVRDELLILRAQILTQDDELLVEDELRFTPRCPDDAQAEFCAEICSG